MPVIVQLITAVGWITSIGIVALVPIDVWASLHKSNRSSVAVMWSIAYWCCHFGGFDITRLDSSV